MKTYEVNVSRTAEKQLAQLPKPDQLRVVNAIRALAIDPHPIGYRKLSGHEDVFRIRIGVYRVIYAVENEHLVILVLKIGHRKDIYR